MGYEKSKKAIEESIADANLGYIDLYEFPFLLHTTQGNRLISP
jgi:diketogulonate reductase-like aldo/keto reductase